MSTGLHARRATGLTVAEREEIFTRTESVARWWREGRAAYERLREALLSYFLFLTGATCSNEAGNNYIRGDGDFIFIFQIFRIFVFIFIFIVFAVLLCRSFVLCACVYPEHGTAGERGAIAGVGGRWRVEGGLEGARSPFS